MKKLLSLLSILTISGTAVPTTIAASPYQKQEELNRDVNYLQTNNLENLNRNKRDPGDKNEFVITDKIYASFTPNLWEEIIQEWYFSNNNLKNFQEKFKEKFKDYRDNKHDFSEWWISEKADDYLDVFAKELWNNWNIIISDWRKSDKLHRIRIVMELNGTFVSVNIRNDDTLYHGNKYLNNQILNELLLNTNINKIINNSDIAILNELNYLNPDLDISQLEIINKTDISSIVKTKNNKGFGEVIVNYKIKNKDEISNINLNELIKKAIFFKFRDENHNLTFKEINYIDTNNLNFANVEVTKNGNSFSSSINIKNICNNKEFINKTSGIKSFNIPACIYNSKYKLTFQILTGLIKNQENKLNSWNINSDDEMKLTDFINPNYTKNSDIINELSNNFDLSNTNKQEKEMIIYYLNEPSDKFEVNPNEKLNVNYSPLRIIKNKNMLNLKQNISGIISSKILGSSNEEKVVTLSIKEAMHLLQKYSLLPDEIIINEDNTITFNGKAFIASEIEGKIKTSIVTSIV